MVDTPKTQILQRALLASELLSKQQFEEALQQTRARDDVHPFALDKIDDEHLGKTLIELGYLNRWQVEQLKAGRTKFTLGPYQIVDSIGRGGMGHVFKAQHSMLGRVEAVKVLPKTKSSPESIESFQREIRAQAQLDHPNLVRVSYAGQDGDTRFFVTEFVPGTDLRKLVRSNGPLTVEQAASIVSQAAEALEYAHARGLVHRDIKPGNLLVTPEGRTKVTDLGLAGCFRNEGESADPTAGKIVGTADYLAPEAIRSPGEIMPESDIYALGCTLYYAVTGKVPFPGGKTSEKLRRHCEEAPITPKRFSPGLSDPFLDVIGDMMAKDVRLRIASATQVVERLAQWVTPGVATGPVAPGSVASGIVSDSQETPTSYDDLQISSSGSGSLSQVSEATDAVLSDMEETIPIQPLGQSGSLNPSVSSRARLSVSKRSLISAVTVTMLVVLATLVLWLW